MTLKDLLVKFGFKVDKQSEQQTQKSIDGLKNFAVKALGAIAIGFSVVKIYQVAEEFGKINDQIKGATRHLGDQSEIQQKILKASNDTRRSYADTAGMVSKLVAEAPNMFDVDGAIEFNNAVTKTFKSAGKSNDEINGLMEAVNKSFAKGAVDSETINQLLERSPEGVKLLNKQLNTTTDKLSQLATDGKIKLSDLRDAFVKNSDQINKDFEDMDYKISDAFLNIKNQWGVFCAGLNEGSGLGGTIAKTMVRAFTKIMDVLKKMQNTIDRIIKFATRGFNYVWSIIEKGARFIGGIVDKLGGAENALKLIAIVAGAIFAALNAGKIIGFLKSVGSLIGGINLKIMLIVAVIVLLALIIDDFINFMKGNDSVIGKLFEKAGIDADKAREKILEAWEKVKTFLISAWGKIKSFGQKTIEKLKDFWTNNSEKIKATLIAAWNLIWKTLKDLWKFLSALAVGIFNGLKDFWAEWGDKILASFSMIWDMIQTVFSIALDIIQNVFKLFSAVFEGDWDTVWSTIFNIVDGAINMIRTVIETILSIIWLFIKDKVDQIREKFLKTFEKIKEGIEKRVENIRKAIEDGINKAVDFIKGLPEKAVTWGKDFIDGFVKGITDNIKKVTDAVKGVADTITSFLHFSVPDEGPLTEYETWMPDFIDGLTSSIYANMPKIEKAAHDMASILATANQVSPATARNVSRAGHRTSNVNQTNTINNNFNGNDPKAQVKGAKAMSKSAKDATGYMSDALKFAR